MNSGEASGCLQEPTKFVQFCACRNATSVICRILKLQHHFVASEAFGWSDQVQSNSELTELSSLIRRIASAISGAMVIWRMFGASRTASVARIESVITMASIGEEEMRATAPPDSTPCVT